MPLNFFAFQTPTQTRLKSKLNFGAFGVEPVEPKKKTSIQLTNELLKSGQATTTPLTSIPERIQTTTPSLLNKKAFFTPSPKGVRIRDFIREFGKTTKEFSKAILQAPQRALVSVGIQPLADIAEKKAEFVPTTKAEKFIFGEEPIKGIRLNVEKAQKISEELSIKAGFDPSTSKGMSLALAPLIVGGFTTADLVPVGGGTKPIKKIASSKNIDKILALLKQIFKKADKEDLKPLANQLIKISDEKKITQIFSDFNKLDKFIKPTKSELKFKIKPEEKKFLTGIKKDIQTGIAKKVVREKKILERQQTALIKKTAVKTTKEITEAKLAIKAEKSVREQELKGLKGLLKERSATKSATAREINKLVSSSEKTLRTQEIKGFRKLIQERVASIKIIERITGRVENVKTIKQSIFEFAKKSLPLEKRGKLLGDVAKAETRGDLAGAFRRIINERNAVIKKDIIKELEKTVKNIDKLPLKAQDKIMSEISGLSFKGMSKETAEKLTKLRDFLSKTPEAKLLFGRKTLTKAKRISELEEKVIRDEELKKLIQIQAKVSKFVEEGKVTKRVIAETKELRREATLKNLKATSHNIDKSIPRTIGAKLTRQEKLGHTKSQIAEQMNTGYMNYVSTDIGFEILDNNIRNGFNVKTFKQPFDEVFFNYKEMSQKIVDGYFDFKKGVEVKHGIKLEKDNMERIMVFATKRQEGGREKLIKSGVEELLPKGTTIDNLTLSKPEQELYEYMRGVFDEMRPFIDETLQRTHDRKLGKVENYFSWQTDFDNSDEIFKRLENDFILSSRTTQGFTKERTLAGRQILRLNAEYVFLKQTNDSAYFINTEEVLNEMGKIARTEDYAEAVGKNGRRWVMGWIDLMARKGIPEGHTPSWAGKILRNIGSGVLGFRISPVVKQPIAKITSSALLGSHAFRHNTKFFSQNLSKTVRQISKQQKFRTFDDPAFVELAKSKKLAKWQEWGYQGIKYVDQYTADSTWYAAYRKYFADHKIPFNLDDFKANKVNKEAVEYSDFIVRRTQGTGETKDLAKMLTSKNKDVFKAFLQFQSFVLNESYLIPHDAIGVAIKTEKDYWKAMGIIGAYLASGIAEDYVSSGIAQIFSPKKYAEEERKKKFMNRIFDSVVSKMPGINKIYSLWKYDSIGVPLIETPEKLFKGGIGLVEGKKPETKIKGLTKMVEALGQLSGVAGSGQLGQAVRRFGIPEEKPAFKFEFKKKTTKPKIEFKFGD